MYLIREDLMYPIGYATTVLYLISLTFFLLAIFIQHFFVIGIALGSLFFIIPSVIIGIMVNQRIET